MNRRTLLGRLAAGAAAIVGAGMAAPKAAAAEIDPIRARLDEVLANPDKHPEIMARARELMGEPIAGLVSGGTVRFDPGYSMGQVGVYTRATGDAAPLFGRAPLTFEAMKADCAARGCELYVSTDGYLRHWFDGPGHMIGEWPGKVGTFTPVGLAQVDAWRRSLHEATVRQMDLGTQIAESRRLRGARPLFFTG